MTIQRNRRGERGQSIVLLAMASLVLAATLLTTFSIGKAIHEKVALQQAADASAYSLAVEEARAFNYYAYGNRSIAAHYVSIMAIYGHMSYAVEWEGFLSGGINAWCNNADSVFNTMTLALIACAAASFGTCPEAACAAWQLATIQYDCDGAQTTLEALDQALGKNDGTLGPTLSAYYLQAQDQMQKIRGVVAAEGQVDQNVYGALSNPSKFTGPLVAGFEKSFASRNVPANLTGLSGSSGLGVGGVGALGSSKTAAGYCDAVAGGKCGSGDVYSPQVHVANASRMQPMKPSGDFTRDRAITLTSTLSVAMDLYFVLPTLGGVEFLDGNGMSRVCDHDNKGTIDDPEPDLHVSGQDKSVAWRAAAHDHGSITALDLICYPVVGAGYADVSAYAYSVPVGNNASDQSAVVFADGTQVTGQTDLGGCQYDAQGVQHCGILEEQLNFRISAASPSQLLFNQPRTFAVVDESFGKASWGPFGIKLDKAIKMFDPTPSTYDNVINDSTKAGRESIFATAQGLAYYHHPGNWREPPNFYNPYWRAKLHPFSSSADVSAVIKSAGYNGNTATDFIKALPVTQ